MYISTLISTVALAASVIATGTYMDAEGAVAATATGTAPAASGSMAMFVVKVSNKNLDLTFEPASFKAPVGSMVQFQFYPKNHSVVQAAFSNPCEPINNVMSNVTGFFSGHMPTTPDTPMMPAFTIPIKDTKPIWYYCSQAKHCQAGMVGVINPPEESTGKTLDAFKTAAKDAAKAGIPDMPSGETPSSASAAAPGSSPAYSSPVYSSSLASSPISDSSSSGSGVDSGSAAPSGLGLGSAAAPSGFSSAGFGSASGSGVVNRPGATSTPFLGAANTLVSISLATFAGLGFALLM